MYTRTFILHMACHNTYLELPSISFHKMAGATNYKLSFRILVLNQNERYLGSRGTYRFRRRQFFFSEILNGEGGGKSPFSNDDDEDEEDEETKKFFALADIQFTDGKFVSQGT